MAFCQIVCVRNQKKEELSMKRRFVNIIKKLEERFTYLVTFLATFLQLVLGVCGVLGICCWGSGWMETGNPMGGLSYLLERVGRLNPNGGPLESVFAKACQEFVRLANGETWIFLAVIAFGLFCLWALSKGSPRIIRNALTRAFAEMNRSFSRALISAKAMPAVGKAKAAWTKFRNTTSSKLSSRRAKRDEEASEITIASTASKR